MKNKKHIFLILMFILMFFLTLPPVFGQDKEPDDSIFSLNLIPGASFSIGRDAEPYKIGGGVSLLARLKTPMLPILFLEAGAGFSIVPLNVASGEPVDKANLYLISPRLGAGINYEIIPKLVVSAHVHGGYYIASLDVETEDSSGHNMLLDTGVNISYKFLPSLSLGVGASYRNFFGLYNDIMLTIGTSYHFRGRSAAGSGGILPPRLTPYSDLEISQLELTSVFPVLFKYYDDHPIGKITITNNGKIPLEEIKISVFVNHYMDNPNMCGEIEFVKGGGEAQIDLYALFNNHVLEISEGTKVQVNITVEFSVAGENYGNETVQTLRIYDRNALTWEDDKRAAAFVTMKDPTVLKFSKNITSMVKGKASKAINANLLTAIALHEAMTLYGMSYQVDPSTPYKKFSKKKLAIDYLQFPNQTLEYKAGDCDDLAILNCALLESVGIKTAFITIPGHIYMAFSLDMSPHDAKKSFLKPENLILTKDNAWVPVEITKIGDGFLKAWELGAKRWREHNGKKQAGFILVHEAWKTFEPVGFSGKISHIKIPPEDKVVSFYLQEVIKFIDTELYPRVSKLKKQIKSTHGSHKYVNKLGILYGRYGLYDKAKAEFDKILAAAKEYVPALVNMGNIAFLSDDMKSALSFYEKAYRKQPSNIKVLLNIARVNHELSKYDDVKRYYTRLVKLDKGLANRFAYLDLKSGNTTARALDADKMKEEMLWDEE